MKRIVSVCPPPLHIVAEYNHLVAEIDDAVAQISEEKFANKIKCRPGCSSCCREFSVLPLEAGIILHYINTSVNVNQGAVSREYCNFLHENLCTIYKLRPIICRTQGIPLGYIDDLQGTIEVSACDINFPAEMALEYEDLLLMDDFNMRLAALNLEYCKNCRIDPEQRISLNALRQD